MQEGSMGMGRAGAAALVMTAALAVPAAQAADVQAGPRFSVSDDADLGLGADVRWTFLREDPRLALSASFDYFFPDDGGDDAEEVLEDFRDLFGDVDLPFPAFDLDTDVEYWEANVNLTWDFTTDRAVIPYAGVGVNYGRAKSSAFGFESDEDDMGANVLAGVRIKRRFYVEAKQEAGGGELFVLTLGVRF
jgi:opacity protein-like surface antigen